MFWKTGLYLLYASSWACQDSQLFQTILHEIQMHKEYLEEIGFGERASGITISAVQKPHIDPSLDLSLFETNVPIPSEVASFDPHLKHTLIAADEESENDPAELRIILDIRLHPTLRKLIRAHQLQIFLGTFEEMVAYYDRAGWELCIQFDLPSSVTYYLAEDVNREKIIIMAGLVSRENLIAQMLTLKLADLPLDNVEIIGELSHFRELVVQDFFALSQAIPTLCTGKHILIVAGCDRKQEVSQILSDHYGSHLRDLISFEGKIISLVYMPLQNPTQEASGFLILDLMYGEIMEPIIGLLLETVSCSRIFIGGAGGYIPRDDRKDPQIGDWIPISKSINAKGERVALISGEFLPEETHLQVPTIFLETYEWLDSAKMIGSSVDVEMFYILRAIRDYNRLHPKKAVLAQCGYFVSDYVGKKALRDYSNVYQQYRTVLINFLNR